MTSIEAYQHLSNLIDQINALVSTFHTAQLMKTHAEEI